MISILSIGPRTLWNDCNHSATAIFWRSAIPLCKEPENVFFDRATLFPRCLDDRQSVGRCTSSGAPAPALQHNLWRAGRAPGMSTRHEAWRVALTGLERPALWPRECARRGRYVAAGVVPGDRHCASTQIILSRAGA